MTQTSRHSVSVAGAVLDGQGRFLAIQRRDNGRWEPPGGVLELGETIQAGLVREVREETGFLVLPERLSGVYKNLSHAIVALVFRCAVVGGQARTSEESAAVEWLTAEEVRDRMVEAFAVRLLDALDDGPTPVRHHDGVSILATAPALPGTTATSSAQRS